MYTLMIVDDSNIIRNRIGRSVLASDINIVAQASNGEEALKLFEEFQPDLITMDLTMPKMDGLECIEKIVAKNRKVSILVVSALSDKATALQALKLGARGFVGKPFSEEDLTNALHKLMAVNRK
ncbi:response regulator [Moraxella lincolnii]|uniref:Response regulator n=1 Tax=Lwoffella lincolnii TaxID=90241 RepID=A0A1T0CJZ2_9GAMM|nr:response regulator [Moraxella lincolnii]OOS22678.1 response regulator [Moraxella lincolnii]